jgi:hypothetical protein
LRDAAAAGGWEFLTLAVWRMTNNGVGVEVEPEGAIYLSADQRVSLKIDVGVSTLRRR